jgi:small subunit ribosomal protein S6
MSNYELMVIFTPVLSEEDFNEKLKIQILRDEQIMRHMITKLDKYAVEYNHVKRNGGFAVKQKMEA